MAALRILGARPSTSCTDVGTEGTIWRGHDDGSVRAVRVLDGEWQCTAVLVCAAPILFITALEGDEGIATAVVIARDGSAHRIDVAGGKSSVMVLVDLLPPYAEPTCLRSVRGLPSTVAVGCADGSVVVVPTHGGKRTVIESSHGTPVHDVNAEADSTRALTCAVLASGRLELVTVAPQPARTMIASDAGAFCALSDGFAVLRMSEASVWLVASGREPVPLLLPTESEKAALGEVSTWTLTSAAGGCEVLVSGEAGWVRVPRAQPRGAEGYFHDAPSLFQ
jgi:hypothetical protein